MATATAPTLHSKIILKFLKHTPIGYMKGRCTMRTNRLIAIVKSMLERANTMHEIARLTSLLVSLQNEHIEALEKRLCKTNNRRKVA